MNPSQDHHREKRAVPGLGSCAAKLGSFSNSWMIAEPRKYADDLRSGVNLHLTLIRFPLLQYYTTAILGYVASCSGFETCRGFSEIISCKNAYERCGLMEVDEELSVGSASESSIAATPLSCTSSASITAAAAQQSRLWYAQDARCAGWLWKQRKRGTHCTCKRLWVRLAQLSTSGPASITCSQYPTDILQFCLLHDRLCYTNTPSSPNARYLPLDRIPVRPLPTGYDICIGAAFIPSQQLEAASGRALPHHGFIMQCGLQTHNGRSKQG